MAKKKNPKPKPIVATVTVGESPEKDVASLRAAFDKIADGMVERSRSESKWKSKQ